MDTHFNWTAFRDCRNERVDAEAFISRRCPVLVDSNRFDHMSARAPARFGLRAFSMTRTPENPHRGLISKSPKFGGHKMGIWMRHLCQKVSIWGVYGPQFPLCHHRWHWKFKILGLGDQYLEVWYHTFQLWRLIGGFASYIWAPKPEIRGGNSMRAQSLYSGVLNVK
jgi:hypothetical protein